MTDETPSGFPTHRPLPSVDMPLLRDDVRANRQKQAVLAATALVALGLAVTVPWLLSALGDEEEAPEDPRNAPGPAVPLALGFTPPRDAGPPEPDASARGAEPPPAPEPIAVQTVDDSGLVRTVHAFGHATGFRAALIAAGLGGAEADALTAALARVMDFRRCRPEHELVVERDASGELRRFEYRASRTQIYEATRDGPRWVGRAVEVPIQRVRLARGGPVTTSLGAALEAAGLGRSLVGTFVEAFEARIDFNTETRAGDAFRIVVDEERVDGSFLRYGTVHALEYRSQRRGVLRAFWWEGRGGDFHDETGRALHGGWLRTPLRYDHISSPFNPRRMHPVLRRIMPHNGIDYAAATGTPVWAAADGVVTFVGARGANGNLVSIRHAGEYETFYAHLSRFATGLTRGQQVRQRQVIGYVGSTGRSTGPHLHFGLKRRGIFIDPARELNGPGRLLPPPHLARFRAALPSLLEELEAIPVPEVALPATPATDAPPPPDDATD